MGSMLGKTKISIDATTLADGDSIAAYLTDAAGALLTSTLVGGKQRLDAMTASEYAEDSTHTSGDYGSFTMAVRHDANTSMVSADGDYAPLQVDSAGALKISGTVTTTATFAYAEDSAAVSGDIGASVLLVRQDTLASSTSADGDYGNFKSTASGELYTRDSGANTSLSTISSTLTALSKAEDAAHASGDQGIQSLLVRQDTLAASTSADGDYGSFKSNNLGELYVFDTTTHTTLTNIKSDTASIVTNTGSTASTLTALSKAEDAAHASGDQGIQSLAVRKDAQGTNVSADGDYSSLLTWSEGSLKVIDIANGTILQQQVTVTNTAAQVPATNLANRKTLMLQNTGANKLYIGSATVTSSGATTGIELPANSFMELECGPAVNVYAVKVGAAANNLNVLETA